MPIFNALNRNLLQASIVIMVIACYAPRRDLHFTVARRFAGKWATDNQPDPWYLLLYIDSPHVLPISGTGYGWPGGMAMVDPDYPAGLLQIDCKQFGRIELKIDRRCIGVAQGYCQFPS